MRIQHQILKKIAPCVPEPQWIALWTSYPKLVEFGYLLIKTISFDFRPRCIAGTLMALRKGLSPDDIANLLREISENESDGGELSCSNLHSDEDIRLSDSDCEESEEIAEM
ncbi:hypothetical protein TNCV_4045551 [Trichonephila clavipes]|nr:hypothetical protein TNCV_4045551 [Trichonephila clavipes]